MTSYFRLLHNDARHAQLGTSSGDGAVGVAVDEGGGVRHAAGLRPVRGHVLHLDMGTVRGQTFTKLRLNESRYERMSLHTFSSILFVSGADS